MNQSNQPFSGSDLSATQIIPDFRFRRLADHDREHTHSAKPPHADLPQPENRKEPTSVPAQSSDQPPVSGPARKHFSIFNVSPIEDALLRETFTGRFTL